MASRSEGGAWCPGWEEVGSVSREFYQLRVLVPFKKSKSTSIAALNDLQNIDIKNNILILQGLLQTAMAVALLFPIF